MHPSTPNIPPIWDGDDDCNVFVRGVIDVWVWLLFEHERSRSGNVCNIENNIGQFRGR